MTDLRALPVFKTLLIISSLIGLLTIAAGPANAAPDTGTNDSTSTTVPRENPSNPEIGDETILPRDLGEKQASADAVAKELDSLGKNMEIAAENYNKAKEELAQTETQIAEAREKLDEATAVFDKRKQVYSERLESIYRNGGTEINFLEVLLQTTNFSDFLSRMNYLMQINMADSNLVSLLEADRETVNTGLTDLETLKATQLDKEQQLKNEQARINEMIKARETLLAGLESEIRNILQEDEVKKSSAQQAFLESLKEKASSTPGSQLTALLDPTSVVATAMQYLGVKYVWGGENPKIGLDCSGLILIVFREHGVKVRHYSGWQFGDAPMKVQKADLKPGDLVFYGAPIHHTGIYIGDGYYIHAPRTGDVVKISSIERPDWAGAVRYPLRNKE